jgi:hypothetical protein
VITVCELSRMTGLCMAGTFRFVRFALQADQHQMAGIGAASHPARGAAPVKFGAFLGQQGHQQAGRLEYAQGRTNARGMGSGRYHDVGCDSLNRQR